MVFANRLTHLKPTSQFITSSRCTASLLTFSFLCVSFYKKGLLTLNIINYPQCTDWPHNADALDALKTVGIESKLQSVPVRTVLPAERRDAPRRDLLLQAAAHC